MQLDRSSKTLGKDVYFFALRPAQSVLKLLKHLLRPLCFSFAVFFISRLLLDAFYQPARFEWWEPLVQASIIAIFTWLIGRDMWHLLNVFLLEESLQLENGTLSHCRKLGAVVVYRRNFQFSRTAGFQYHHTPGRSTGGKYNHEIPPFDSLQFYHKGNEVLVFKNIQKNVAIEVAAQLNARNPNVFR